MELQTQPKTKPPAKPDPHAANLSAIAGDLGSLTRLCNTLNVSESDRHIIHIIIHHYQAPLLPGKTGKAWAGHEEEYQRLISMLASDSLPFPAQGL